MGNKFKEKVIFWYALAYFLGFSLAFLGACELFKKETSYWLFENFKPFLYSALVLFVAFLIQILRAEDFIDFDEGNFVLLWAHMVISALVAFDDVLASLNLHGIIGPQYLALTPSILYILRAFFKRFNKIQDKLKELDSYVRQNESSQVYKKETESPKI
jgi:hypothetical protein